MQQPQGMPKVTHTHCNSLASYAQSVSIPRVRPMTSLAAKQCSHDCEQHSKAPAVIL